MKPLPTAVLTLLATLPDETCKVILNTNRRGHWEVEVFTRYIVEEEPKVKERLRALEQQISRRA